MTYGRCVPIFEAIIAQHEGSLTVRYCRLQLHYPSSLRAKCFLSPNPYLCFSHKHILYDLNQHIRLYKLQLYSLLLFTAGNIWKWIDVIQAVVSAKQYHSICLKIHSTLAINSPETHVMSVILVAVATHLKTRQLIRHNTVCPSFLYCYAFILL